MENILFEVVSDIIRKETFPIGARKVTVIQTEDNNVYSYCASNDNNFLTVLRHHDIGASHHRFIRGIHSASLMKETLCYGDSNLTDEDIENIFNEFKSYNEINARY